MAPTRNGWPKASRPRPQGAAATEDRKQLLLLSPLLSVGALGHVSASVLCRYLLLHPYGLRKLMPTRVVLCMVMSFRPPSSAASFCMGILLVEDVSLFPARGGIVTEKRP